MPVQIREIIMKATISESKPGKGASGSRDKANQADDRESIIAECMDNVARMLKEFKDR